MAELESIEPVIVSLVAQQLLMGALLQNLTMGQDDDVVGVLDGGQTVCHDQHGADGLHPLQRVLNQ